jgi:hypothetical protein
MTEHNMSYISMIVGALATASYFVTFYLTTKDQIYFAGENGSGNDTKDLPYDLAIAECIASGSLVLISLLAFRNKREPWLAGTVLVGIAMAMHAIFAVIRGVNTGILFDDVSRTCSDKGLSGCPTTRYEATAAHQDIMFSSPFGGQCSFFFWGPAMKARYEGLKEGTNGEPLNDACAGWAQNNGRLCDQTIETNMDWSKASSYGWRDDTSDITSLLFDANNANTIKKEHNMEILYKLQQQIVNVSSGAIPPEYRYKGQPSFAYCWYWGCSDVCTSHRYHVNMWWFYSSVVMTVADLVIFIWALKTLPDDEDVRHRSLKDEMSVAEAVGLEDGEFFAPRPPVTGRRRRIQQNPSGLLF